MISDHHRFRELAVQPAMAATSERCRLSSPAETWLAASAARWLPSCYPPKPAPQIPRPNGSLPKHAFWK
jgi:hypothetical protein